MVLLSAKGLVLLRFHEFRQQDDDIFSTLAKFHYMTGEIESHVGC